MLMHVKRSEMLAQLKKVFRAVPKKSVDPALEGVHIEADARTSVLTMTATNCEVAIRSSMLATVEEPGSTVVNIGCFPQILERLPEEDVDIEMRKNNVLHIQSGCTEYDLNVLPGEKYPMPELPFPEDTVPVSGLRSLARKTLFATAEDSTAPVLQCVRLSLGPDGLKASGTNSYCAVEAEGDPECKGATELLLPAHSLRVLASISGDSDVYEMGLTGRTLTFWNGSLLFSARLVEGKFPDTAYLLNSFKGEYSVNLDAGELVEALQLVAAVGGDRPRVELAFGEHEVGITLMNPFVNAVSSVKALILNAPSKPFYYDCGKLLEYLGLLSGKITLEFDSSGTLCINSGKTRYLQCPLRPGQAARAEKAA